MTSETNNRGHDKISVQANVLLCRCVERGSAESVSHEDGRHTESHQCVLNVHIKLTSDSSKLLQWTLEIQSFILSLQNHRVLLQRSCPLVVQHVSKSIQVLFCSLAGLSVPAAHADPAEKKTAVTFPASDWWVYHEYLLTITDTQRGFISNIKSCQWFKYK